MDYQPFRPSKNVGIPFACRACLDGSANVLVILSASYSLFDDDKLWKITAIVERDLGRNTGLT